VVADQSARVSKFSFPVAFEEEIIARIAGSLPGMKPGEARKIEIRSERPADVPEKEQVVQLALVRQRPKELRMTKGEYKSRTSKEPQEGEDFIFDPLIPGKVASVSENEVLIYFSAQPGSVVETPFGKGTIRENANQFEIVIDAVKGALVRTGPIVGRISDVQDRMFTIDYGNPFGGETLSCDVKVEPAPPADVASAKE
jgi:FKBP-type peptidyl-prolyl cis-trans isomerase 2